MLWVAGISFFHYEINVKADSKENVVVMGYLPILDHLACVMADDRENKIHSIRFNSWPEIVDAFRSERLDAAVLLIPQVYALHEQGIPVKIVGLVQRHGTALVVSKRINGLSDLAGKAIAVNSRYSVQYLLLNELLEEEKLNDDVHIIELPPPEMPSALSAKQIDGFICGEPYPAASVLNGDAKVLMHAHERWPDFISTVLVTRQDSKNKELVQQVYKAIVERGAWIESHREKIPHNAAAIYRIDESILQQALNEPPSRQRFDRLSITTGDEKFLQKIADEMLGVKLLKSPLVAKSLLLDTLNYSELP